ncbi:hypothetical protein GCM10022408_32490 [Hymenobacter fastidiosus]|uniref:Uncharacterized protein n=1 Tax=Hymenobacter fastidiosus TaxID=486264 RepID=A0ABP7SU63_9BACT
MCFTQGPAGVKRGVSQCHSAKSRRNPALYPCGTLRGSFLTAATKVLGKHKSFYGGFLAIQEQGYFQA